MGNRKHYKHNLLLLRIFVLCKSIVLLDKAVSTGLAVITWRNDPTKHKVTQVRADS